MVRLYLLGFTHDLKGVVFSQRKSGKTGTFWVPIDESFLGAVDKLQRARTERDRGKKAAPKSRSKDVVGLKELPPAARSRALPPVGRSVARSGLPASEIQQLLREGKSIKTVAAAAKTELAWVERLAEPVITERLGVVRLAQRAYMVRPRLGPSGLQLGEAVQRNLEERRASIDGLDDAWDARSGPSGTWRVWIRFSYRGKRRSAEWEFRKGSRSISPRNRLASELGWWAPERADEPELLPAGTEGDVEDDALPATEQPKPRRKTAAKRRAPARRPKSKARTKRAPTRKRKQAKRGSRRPAPRRRR